MEITRLRTNIKKGNYYTYNKLYIGGGILVWKKNKSNTVRIRKQTLTPNKSI